MFVIDCNWNMNTASIAKNTVPLVQYIRKSHPATPIVLAEVRSKVLYVEMFYKVFVWTCTRLCVHFMYLLFVCVWSLYGLVLELRLPLPLREPRQGRLGYPPPPGPPRPGSERV
jgi:hypothetical protein